MRKTVAEYLAQRHAEGLSETTVWNLRQRMKLLTALLLGRGIRRWRDVRPQDLEACFRSIRRRRYAFRTREMLRLTTRSYFGWLVAQGRIFSDPSRNLALKESREDHTLLEPPLEEDEVARLLASLPRRRPFDWCRIAHIELLYSAGLRLGESLSLDVRDVDLTGRVVHVRRGKGGKARDVPMMTGLRTALRKYLACRRSLLKGPDHGALLLSLTGKRLRKECFEWFIRRLNARRGPSKPHVHAHLFRHSIAVHLLRGGADIRYIQAFLGHESLDTTKTYLRLVPADIRKAYDQAMPDIPVKYSR